MHVHNSNPNSTCPNNISDTYLKDCVSHQKFDLPQEPVLTPFLTLTSRTVSHTKKFDFLPQEGCLTLASRRTSPDTILRPDTIFDTYLKDCVSHEN